GGWWEFASAACWGRSLRRSSPRGATGQGPGGLHLKEEESLASEFGFRYLDPQRAFGAQAVAFYTHFNDLIVVDILASGPGSGDDFNAGKVFAGIQNVFDQRYLASRHPYGARPGAPLFGYMGIEAVY
ncbi:MAG TPA: hypothetical protein VMY37_16415, partial [Thermoguttaceae bacterium]|nr:hypothetical protein [Thermoguttaceae bacterium]